MYSWPHLLSRCHKGPNGSTQSVSGSDFRDGGPGTEARLLRKDRQTGGCWSGSVLIKCALVPRSAVSSAVYGSEEWDTWRHEGCFTMGRGQVRGCQGLEVVSLVVAVLKSLVLAVLKVSVKNGTHGDTKAASQWAGVKFGVVRVMSWCFSSLQY